MSTNTILLKDLMHNKSKSKSNYIYETIFKDNTLPANIRKKINVEIANLVNNKYFQPIPLEKISDILNKYDIILLNEDNTEYEGFLTGRTGRANIDMGIKSSGVQKNGFVTYSQIYNSKLILSWYKMEVSGRYEVVAYLS